eukprot:m.89788 g.89788  ORF g.89788 m.89788 type:complete len:1228 (+) comp26333_c0_seq1:92-3775(+)
MSILEDIILDGEGADRLIGDKRVRLLELCSVCLALSTFVTRIVSTWCGLSKHVLKVPVYGWSGSFLLPTDRRPKFSTHDGRHGFNSLDVAMPPDGWLSFDASAGWFVWTKHTCEAENKTFGKGATPFVCEAEDKDGWFYAVDFPNAFENAKRKMTCVRRRRLTMKVFQPSNRCATAATAQQAMTQLKKTMGDPLPPPQTCLAIEATDCTYRVDEHGVCHFELRFSWALPQGETEEQPLVSILKKTYFSVTRRWNHFKRLCDKFERQKKKHPALPSASMMTHLGSSFGNVKAAHDEHVFRAAKLPMWLNQVLTSEQTREDHYLKLFVWGDNSVLDLFDLMETNNTIDEALGMELAMIAQSRDMTTWLSYCFENKMLQMSTASLSSQNKLRRTDKLMIRRRNENERSDASKHMTSQFRALIAASQMRTTNHRERLHREMERLALQQSTEFVVVIDRVDDTQSLAMDIEANAAMAHEFNVCCNTMSKMENDHRNETEQWQLATMEIQKEPKTQQTEIQAWLLSHMAVTFLTAKVSPEENPFNITSTTFDCANAALGALRGKMGQVLDESTEPVNMQLEHELHVQEAQTTFPEHKHLIGQEEQELKNEEEARRAEEKVRIEERILFKSKIDAQETPVRAVLARQQARAMAQQTMLQASATREHARQIHSTMIANLRDRSQARKPLRQQRVAQCDSCYNIAEERLQAQRLAPHRLFFVTSNTLPPPVPQDYPDDQDKALRAAQKNDNDEREHGSASEQAPMFCINAKEDESTMNGPQGWYAYNEKVIKAEAEESLPVLDGSFLAHMRSLAEAYENAKSMETNTQSQLEGTLGAEKGFISNLQLAYEFSQLQEVYKEEAANHNDEITRSDVVRDRMNQEGAARQAKEVVLQNELAVTRNAASAFAATLNQSLTKFNSDISLEDVQTFFNIEMPSWHGGETRFDHVLLEDYEHARQACERTRSRHGHVDYNAWEKVDARLHKMEDRLGRIRKKLEAARRGERQLHGAVKLAQMCFQQCAPLLQMSIQVLQPGHELDIWLQAHIVNQTLGFNDLNATKQTFNQFQQQVNQYSLASFMNNLTSYFGRGDNLIKDLQRELKHLRQALNEEDKTIKHNRKQKAEEWKKNLAASTSNLRVDGATISATCISHPWENPHPNETSINLDKFVHNENGHFNVSSHSSNDLSNGFSVTARNIRLQHSTLVCGLQKSDGSWNGGQKLDLNSILMNKSGKLVRKK